jgi:glycosyltransferase involved in cell wall biosynthesis
MTNKVSIIVPCYNAESTIDLCIGSILKQSYQNFEVIVIDDSSSDRSFEIIEKYSGRIIYSKNESNIGPSLTRNIAVNKSSGEILLFIDADSCLHSDSFLESLVEHIKMGEDVLVGVQESVPLNDNLFAYYWAFYRNLLWDKSDWEYTTAWSLNRGVITRSVWNHVGKFNENYKGADVEDLEYGYRMEALGYRVKICRDLKTVNTFPTLYESMAKIPRRTYQWLFLVKDRKKVDNISTSGNSVIKSLISLCLVISLMLNIYLFFIFLAAYLLVTRKFLIECFSMKPKYFWAYPFIDLFVHLLPFGAPFYILRRTQ